MENHGLGMVSDKMCEDTIQPKIPQILHNLLGQSAQIGSNIWDIIGKSPH